jgi:hypothetical protein
MKNLADIKLISKLTIPSIGELSCKGLTLIVGPNSSGKTQLLQDIYHRLTGRARTFVVASAIEIEKPDKSIFKILESEGFIKEYLDDNDNKHWLPLTFSGQAAPTIQANQADTWYTSYDPLKEYHLRRPNEFLNYFGRMLVSALFLDRRLSSLGATGVIDFEKQPPQSDLHALYINDVARGALWTESLNSFGRAIWPDVSRGNQLCLRVSERGKIPSAEDMLSVEKMKAYGTIEEEGDGLKSYAATCIALLLGRLPVCLIDEPELCLHPPQAYNLGRFIGSHAGSANTATFVATHSSQILRGVVQAAKEVSIVRMTRVQGAFSAHLVPPDVISNALAKPTLRAESILDGIFSESVMIVEADGDRLVYNTVLETLSSELRLDVHLAAIGGTGGIADTCGLYRKLRIPVAVIADLDVIADVDRLKRIVEVLVPPNEAQSLQDSAKFLIEEVRKLPPTVDETTFKQRLLAISQMGTNWTNADDIPLRRDLNKLANDLDRMRRLKSGGISNFPESISSHLRDLLNKLKTHGIFLVPVGELEGWLAPEHIKSAKSNKWSWANEAAQVIQARGSQRGDIWDFVREVGSYLKQE